jgi:hypothetical protein
MSIDDVRLNIREQRLRLWKTQIQHARAGRKKQRHQGAPEMRADRRQPS